MKVLFDKIHGSYGLSKGVPIKGRPGLVLQQTKKGKRWKRIGGKPKSDGVYFNSKDSKFYASEGSFGWNLHENESPVKMHIKTYDSLKKLKEGAKKIAELNKKYSSAKYKAGSRVMAKVGKGTESAWVKRVVGKDSYIVGLVDSGSEIHLKNDELFPRFSTGQEWKKSIIALILSKAMPSKAQAEAGNYKKKHIRRDGLEISIENVKGSYRKDKETGGKKWKTLMHHHYGYIKDTKGYDKDHVDVFVNPGSKEGGPVFIVNQCDPKTGNFDEQKVCMGFDTEAAAKKAYLSNYQKGWKGIKSIVAMPMFHFKDWVKSSEPAKGEVSRPKVKGKDISYVSKKDYDAAAAHEVAMAGAMVNPEAGKEFYDFYQKHKPFKKSILICLNINRRN